ncbi:autotransporter outer membrane beta-barrel domain-containing protein [Pseudomonas sp. MWU16-30317]|uniref:autotransporter family protein n=1 Tax=Pseudomonas sp. MWU16-30317 TaxID=2878095 RepID=UPI001CFBF44F|nr:autotransporter outer membrane beta-barrel domain-containing protein [Pseudomonas sp. MWU16-30317]
MRVLKVSGLATLTSLAVLTQAAYGACSFSPTLGDDAYVCDSGTAPSLTDLQGNNRLTLPAGGSGTITGAVTFGAGADQISIGSGTIGGAVSQGADIDDFIMTGGRIASLAQGDGRDTFRMTGGTIVGAFEDGDVAAMSGGTIGRVDMKLDNNVFDLSGGRIIGNLVTGFGLDTVTVSGGSIGGNISVSGGNDVVTVSGGSVGGNILMSFGDDRFIWRDGGTIAGTIQMGDGTDSVLLSGLTESLLASSAGIDGSTGIDTLTFDRTTSRSGARYSNFEQVNLDNGSTLDLDDRLVLGDSGTGTGNLGIDSTSVLSSSQGGVAPFTAGQNVSVDNAGLIDLTTSGSRADDRLTIVGNYVGSNGQLRLQSVLAGDGAASDRLVVSQGTLSGSTAISVVNLNGTGALTTANGIQVVEANNGASSSNGAFSLASAVSAGAYQYYLFKGGITAGSENSWYLRSSVVALPVAATPSTPSTPGDSADPSTPAEPVAQSAPIAAVGTPALPAAAAGQSIALYRVEVPLYSVIPPAAALLAQTSLGTFHERQGSQRLLHEAGWVPAGWARVFGNSLRQSWAGDAAPSLNASIDGYQVGHDLYAHLNDDGYWQRAGVFVSHAHMSGDVKGFALGFDNTHAGRLRLDGDSLGAYWSLIGPQEQYLDLVLMGTRYDGRSRSERGLTLNLDGHGVSASAEVGYPLRISDHWRVEPQAQLVAQRVDLDASHDAVAKVGFDNPTTWRGRLGARLLGDYQIRGVPMQPYLRTDLWRTSGGDDGVTYDHAETLHTRQRSTTLDLGGGVAARLNSRTQVYLSAGYSRNLDSVAEQSLQGTLGLRISW